MGERDFVLEQIIAQIAVAYLERHTIARAEIGILLSDIRQGLLDGPSGMLTVSDGPVQPSRPNTDQSSDDEQDLRTESSPQAGQASSPARPAVPVDQSITDDYIISLEDGKPYRSLRRHLMAKYGMSPDDYREKWGLPSDYPMVAPSYARERSEVAKRTGLGLGAQARGKVVSRASKG